MKYYGNDDELERALFALDLEEPPADLRQSILASTIYHVPVAATVRPWEVWLYGGLCAALVWLMIAVIRGTAAPAFDAAASYGEQFLAFFSQPAVLFWIAIGAAATFWISQVNLTVTPGYQRATRR
ncbi:MAG TPA: hypothetical protein VJP85_00140 [Candidatus Baltobacteraceae bacterium]|nr:hypothetical protein [Candidatus Baltobacteraceae bacterium]